MFSLIGMTVLIYNYGQAMKTCVNASAPLKPNHEPILFKTIVTETEVLTTVLSTQPAVVECAEKTLIAKRFLDIELKESGLQEMLKKNGSVIITGDFLDYQSWKFLNGSRSFAMMSDFSPIDVGESTCSLVESISRTLNQLDELVSYEAKPLKSGYELYVVVKKTGVWQAPGIFISQAEAEHLGCMAALKDVSKKVLRVKSSDRILIEDDTYKSCSNYCVVTGKVKLKRH